MKPISQIKFEIHKDGKRIDKEILGIDFPNNKVTGVVCYVDKRSRVQWAGFPIDVKIYVG